MDIAHFPEEYIQHHTAKRAVVRTRKNRRSENHALQRVLKYRATRSNIVRAVQEWYFPASLNSTTSSNHDYTVVDIGRR